MVSTTTSPAYLCCLSFGNRHENHRPFQKDTQQLQTRLIFYEILARQSFLGVIGLSPSLRHFPGYWASMISFAMHVPDLPRVRRRGCQWCEIWWLVSGIHVASSYALLIWLSQPVDAICVTVSHPSDYMQASSDVGHVGAI